MEAAAIWAGVLGLALGGGLVFAVLRGRIAELGRERDRWREEAAGAQEAALGKREAETRLEAERQAHEEKLKELGSIKDQIQTDLKLLTEETLRGSSNSLLERAKEIFDRQQKESREGLQRLVKPIDEQLTRYRDKLDAMEKERVAGQASLAEKIREMTDTTRGLEATTGELANALRFEVKARGQWGEHQLRRILEMSGMMEHVDFEIEVSVWTGDAHQRPDAILNLPGGRRIVVDAKAPMSAYLDSLKADKDEARKKLLADHAKQLSRHIQQLGSKQYWKQFPDAPDFVVLFLPNDNLYAAAFMEDPTLFDSAYEQNVVVVTPSTFLALAKAVAFGWRQEQVARNAVEIQRLGSDLYRRLAKLAEKLGKVTSSIDRTVQAHNDFVASFEGRALPGARKMRDLEIGEGEIGSVRKVETTVRAPKQIADSEIQ